MDPLERLLALLWEHLPTLRQVDERSTHQPEALTMQYPNDPSTIRLQEWVGAEYFFSSAIDSLNKYPEVEALVSTLAPKGWYKVRYSSSKSSSIKIMVWTDTPTTAESFFQKVASQDFVGLLEKRAAPNPQIHRYATPTPDRYYRGANLVCDLYIAAMSTDVRLTILNATRGTIPSADELAFMLHFLSNGLGAGYQLDVDAAAKWLCGIMRGHLMDRGFPEAQAKETVSALIAFLKQLGIEAEMRGEKSK